jgi:NTE family protein
MSLGTIIHSGLVRPSRIVHGLVLMGGGARTAYQAGVLGAICAMLRLQPGKNEGSFPFQVLVGTSAGALNVSYLASGAARGLVAFDELRAFWSDLHCEDVYRLEAPMWVRFSRLLAAVKMWGQGAPARRRAGHDAAGRHLAPRDFAGASTRRCSPRRWTPWPSPPPATPPACTGPSATPAPTTSRSPGTGPGRRAEFQPLTIEHLMASSAIPFLFPATPLWVDGRREYFGDGSMRQVSPLSPAVHLGAQKVLVVGVGQPERSGLGAGPSDREPGLGGIAAMPWPACSTTRCRRRGADPAPGPHAAAVAARDRGGAALPADRGAGDPADAIAGRHRAHPRAPAAPTVQRALGGLGALRRAARRWPATCCSSLRSCRR